MDVFPNPAAAPQVSAVASTIKGLMTVSFPTASIILTSVLGLAVIVAGSPKLRSHTSRSLLSWLNILLGGSSHTVTLPGPSGLPIVGSLFDVSSLQPLKLAKSEANDMTTCSFKTDTLKHFPVGQKSTDMLFGSRSVSEKR